MKKLSLFLCAVFALAVLVGCSKKSTKDEYGIYYDFDETLEATKKNNKKILLVFTKLESGGFNETLVNDVFHASDYIEKIGAEFETCVIDFSNSKLSDKSKKQKAQNERDMQVTVIYGVETPPTVMILTSKGYVISVITYLSSKDVNEFANLIEVEREKISAMEQMVYAVESSTGLERIAAIDLLYENTSNAYRYQLRHLAEEVVKLDKKNESGLVGKYLLADASSTALDCYIERNPKKAADAYLKHINSKFLSVEQKQQSYFAAAYITGNETPSMKVSEKILGYLKSAIELDPETAIGQRCIQLAERRLEILKRQKAVEDQKAQKEASE